MNGKLRRTYLCKHFKGKVYVTEIILSNFCSLKIFHVKVTPERLFRRTLRHLIKMKRFDVGSWLKLSDSFEGILKLYQSQQLYYGCFLSVTMTSTT